MKTLKYLFVLTVFTSCISGKGVAQKKSTPMKTLPNTIEIPKDYYLINTFRDNTN